MLAAALARNTRFKGMEAEVRAAEASMTLAYKARMPDVSVGLMADVKTNPTLYRPWGTVSLPIWRDKLAAEVAQAQANKRAGEARLSAEQIALAVAVAEKDVPLPRGQPQPRAAAEPIAAQAAPIAGGGPLRLPRRPD